MSLIQGNRFVTGEIIVIDGGFTSLDLNACSPASFRSRPEFAQRYREKGYWQDKSLAEEFAVVLRTVTRTGSP